MHPLFISIPLSKFRREPSEQLHSLAIYQLLNPYFNILNFRKQAIQRVSFLMFKISKCDVPKPFHALFRINNSYHNYQTRRSESIHVPIDRTEAIYKTFSYYGAHIWNHISNNI